MEQEFFPVVQGVPGLTAGPLGSMVDKAHSDPQSLFNILLSPDALKAIPDSMQQALLPPLKTALADSLQLVFLIAMLIIAAGIIISFFMGNGRVEHKSERPAAEEAGLTLFTDGLATEAELAAELVPDLISNKLPTKK